MARCVASTSIQMMVGPLRALVTISPPRLCERAVQASSPRSNRCRATQQTASVARKTAAGAATSLGSCSTVFMNSYSCIRLF